MRLIVVGLAAIAAAVAVGAADLTGAERDPVAWSLDCTLRSDPPCGKGVEVGKDYYYAL